MLKREVDFGLDNFGRQKILSQSESVAQLIVNLLLMKPGQMPSMPHIGINIKKYLYEFEDNINTGALQKEIEEQCSTLIPYIDTENMSLFVIKESVPDPILMIIIPFDILDDGKDLVMAFKKSKSLGMVSFNYEFQSRDLLQ